MTENEMRQIACRNCGGRNRESASFCLVCGSSLSTMPPMAVHFDPTVTAAAIGASAAALSAILTYLATREMGKIVIQGKDGTRVEFPENTPLGEYTRYIRLAQLIDKPTILVSDPNDSELRDILTLYLVQPEQLEIKSLPWKERWLRKLRRRKSKD